MVISVVYLLVRYLLDCLTVLSRGQASKDAELLVLRPESGVLRRQAGRIRRDGTGDRCSQAAPPPPPGATWLPSRDGCLES